MSNELSAELKEQFRRQWETLRDLVGNVPDGQWRAGEVDYLIPARLVYHVLSGTEVYARSSSYEEYTAHRRFGLDWKTAPAPELPDKPTTLRSIDEMQKAVEEWLRTVGDQGLMATHDGFPWTGSRTLSRALFLLRHTQNHIGEANAELRRRGLPRGKWK